MRPAAALAAALLLAACGGDDGDDAEEVPEPGGAYDVVLTVGAVLVDPSAEPPATPAPGDTFDERWTLDCDDTGCTLGRPEGGVVLGDLDGLTLAPVEGRANTWSGEATGVRPAAPSPCGGSPTERWTVQVEIARTPNALSGSVYRIPDALVDGDCLGLDLTLGVGGTPDRGDPQ